MPALALTDHGAMFGAVEFYQAASKAGLKPHRRHGGLRHPRPRARTARASRRAPPGPAGPRRDRLPQPDAALLARLPRGLLLQAARGPRAARAARRGPARALRLPAGRGARPTCSRDDEAEAARTALCYRDLFGAENYFLEIMNHGLEIEDRDPRPHARRSPRAPASRWSPPTTTTTWTATTPRRRRSCSASRPARRWTTRSGCGRWRTCTSARPRRWRQAFADFPDALRNTVAVAERCNLQLPVRPAAAAGVPAAGGRDQRPRTTCASWPGPSCRAACPR